MNALSEIGEILTAIKIPWQTGAYTESAPDQYVVLVPLSDTFDIVADNRPQFDVQAVRLSIFSKGNYNLIKNQLVRKRIGKIDQTRCDNLTDQGHNNQRAGIA